MKYENQHIPSLSSPTKKRLEELGVAVIYVFGSRISGKNLPFSDIDVGVVMKDPKLFQGKTTKLHSMVYDILASDLSDGPGGPRLDISFLQKANPVLGMKAIKEGKILFESEPTLRADFEETVFLRYNDYRKLQREFQEATLQAFSPSLSR
jgi:predicted nucleotidyltransferase